MDDIGFDMAHRDSQIINVVRAHTAKNLLPRLLWRGYR